MNLIRKSELRKAMGKAGNGTLLGEERIAHGFPPSNKDGPIKGS